MCWLLEEMLCGLFLYICCFFFPSIILPDKRKGQHRSRYPKPLKSPMTEMKRKWNHAKEQTAPDFARRCVCVCGDGFSSTRCCSRRLSGPGAGQQGDARVPVAGRRKAKRKQAAKRRRLEVQSEIEFGTKSSTTNGVLNKATWRVKARRSSKENNGTIRPTAFKPQRWSKIITLFNSLPVPYKQTNKKSFKPDRFNDFFSS